MGHMVVRVPGFPTGGLNANPWALQCGPRVYIYSQTFCEGKTLGWTKISLRFVHTLLQKTLNDLFWPTPYTPPNSDHLQLF